MQTNREERLEWRFCVSGNILGEHVGEDGNTYNGTKAFTAGTKVYIHGGVFDPNKEEVLVIGLNRFHRYVFEGVPKAYISNVRFQTVYKPAVNEMMSYGEKFEGEYWYGRTVRDKKAAMEYAEKWNNGQSY